MAATYPTIHRITVTDAFSMGKTNSTLMDTVFPSPLAGLTAEKYWEQSLIMLLGPDAGGGGDSPTKSEDFPTYERGYKGAPDFTLGTAPSTTSDKIGSHYYPNVAAPSGGDDPNVDGKTKSQVGYPFAQGAGGDGAIANPSETSAVHAVTIGQYFFKS